MEYELTQMPFREPKPRDNGLTMVMDKGLSFREAEDFLSVAGACADIIKLAMIQLQPKLKSLDATLLLQVHDELIFEVRPDLWEEVRSLIQVTMESAVQLSVPLKVDIHSGKNWMETK